MEVHKKVVVVGLVLTIAIAGLEPILADGLFCGASIDGLLACKPSVAKENPVPPSTKCCSAIEDADFACLCKNKYLAALNGVDIDKAMQLPGKCHINKSYQCK